MRATTISLILFAHISLCAAYFKDVSTSAGLQRALGRGRKKYGGAAVADLDGDGWPDLLLGHHDDRNCELYFNLGNGRFAKSSWGVWNDSHALTPFRFSPYQRSLHFAISTGGGWGLNPSSPAVLSVSPSRAVRNVTLRAGLSAAKGRGRSMIFVPLGLGAPSFLHADALVLNAPLDVRKVGKAVSHFAYAGVAGGRFQQRGIGQFGKMYSPYGGVADVNGDGFPEVVTWSDLTMHKVTGYFKLRDVSSDVFPQSMKRFGVVAVAELDFDNDGLWDLYVARSSVSDLKYLAGKDMRDYLLRNVGGRYVDVSQRAGIPQWARDTRGVTTGDFDNDGWVDIIVTRMVGQDMLLRNNGDGTFTARGAGFKRKKGVYGDMATAVDYDQDGRLDVVLSEGDYFNVRHGGHYRLMKNMATGGGIGNFILVAVGNEPSRRATSLHAVVTVVVTGGKQGGMKMVRRVGSPGTAVSNSYIETLHFGIGRRTSVASVSVRWINGTSRRQRGVKAGTKVVFGVR